MKGYQNPISPALHPIPARCPFCHDKQYDGEHATSGPIEDFRAAPMITSVAHSRCIPEDLKYTHP